MKNAINWFEIPVKNFEKAKSFYEEVLGAEMQLMEMKEMGSTMAFLPFDMENGGIGGSIISGPGYEPSQKGALIYLNGGEDYQIPYRELKKQEVKLRSKKPHLAQMDLWLSSLTLKVTEWLFIQKTKLNHYVSV